MMTILFDEAEAKGEVKGRIKGAIELYRDELGLSPAEIIRRIMDRFGLQKAEAEEYVEQTLGLELA